MAVNQAGGRWWIPGLIVVLAVLYTIGVEAPLCALEGEPLVTSVTIRGQKRIESQAIEGRLTLRPQDRYTADALREQVKILYTTGYFEDVQVETETSEGGIAVVFVVVEKPFITEIVFDGNEELSDDKLKEKLTIKSQTFLDQQQAKESAEKIRLAYQEDGFFNCQVIPVIQTVDEDRKRLTFFIKEGTKAKVRRVHFEGMRTVTKEEMFKVTAVREWIPWYGLVTQLKVPSLLSDAGVLKREELGNDIERMREVYLNKGYLNVQISQPTLELSDDKKWFEITYAIVEGEPFIVQEVGFRGNTVFEDHELREGLNIKPGEIFQRAKIRGEITRITDMYGAKGYAFADVVPNVTPDNNARTATILLNVKEGEMMRIREIHVSGNDKTRDNVVRRELRLDEQDVIDTLALKRSFQRLNNLNFFETVEILPQQIDTDKVDLNVRVKEKPTGQFSIGGGFSTLDKLVAIADITEGNLGGRGWLGRVRGQLGQQRSLGLITFRNPYVNDSYNALQLDVYRTMTNYISYFESKSGASVSWSRWLSEYVNGSVSLFGEQLTYKDPQAGLCPDLIPLICRQLGSQSSTGFRSSIFRDTRDYYLDPRTGWRVSIGADYGTPALGGTNHFYKLYFDVVKYTPLIYDTRFSIRVRYGQVEGLEGKPIPLTERFFVGGINTMRGFVFGRAGPVTPSGSLLGSAKQLIFNNDFIFTISSEAKLNGVFFFDYGNGFDDNEPVSFNLRSAVGFEARWISPFGPLRASYGINLDPRPTERQGVFEFTIGSLF
ncbi:MAG: putative outer membrane protein assembly factor YaeT precursor [Nitrospira sp.]|jgi:outer membrane protein insertion porin family|nr:putative outer membrane protein assembly factor YaeT precursor [Nitrospira sp.]